MIVMACLVEDVSKSRIQSNMGEVSRVEAKERKAGDGRVGAQPHIMTWPKIRMIKECMKIVSFDSLQMHNVNYNNKRAI